MKTNQANLAKINIDDFYQLNLKFPEKKVVLFAELFVDFNPINLNEKYAKNSIFFVHIIHGALAASVFSAIFANTLLGQDSINLKSLFKFIRSIQLNKLVMYLVKVIEKMKLKIKFYLKQSRQLID